jgi:hypothetical protein
MLTQRLCAGPCLVQHLIWQRLSLSNCLFPNCTQGQVQIPSISGFLKQSISVVRRHLIPMVLAFSSHALV